MGMVEAFLQVNANVPQTQTKFALGTPRVEYISAGGVMSALAPSIPPPSAALAQQFAPPTLGVKFWAGSAANGSHVLAPPTTAVDEQKVDAPCTVLAVIGYNKSASRQFFRLIRRSIIPANGTTSSEVLLISFPVEGLQAFSYSEPIRVNAAQGVTPLSRTFQAVANFAANADVTTPLTAGAFFGTIITGPM